VAGLAQEQAAFMRGETAEESADALVAPARAFEEGREFAKAIDAYLAVTAVRCKEHDVLEAVWENAVKLAMNHVPERIGEPISSYISPRSPSHLPHISLTSPSHLPHTSLISP
jgi:hypothetical protein